eukprot:TRINITY_DN11910_c0_g2_i1.p1 TRINITY_DN11910_c0_g2~~TRINITY_DN11910_c0_g2_i1.p1  ORF type:complete len:1516 (+),score=440.75 TRINITY_DN11910_c0_g2_i1:524-4549(+)
MSSNRSNYRRPTIVRQEPAKPELQPDARLWSSSEVLRWLKENGFDDFKEPFYANGFVGKQLLAIKAMDFRAHKFSEERCQALAKAIAELKQSVRALKEGGPKPSAASSGNVRGVAHAGPPRPARKPSTQLASVDESSESQVDDVYGVPNNQAVADVPASTTMHASTTTQSGSNAEVTPPQEDDVYGTPSNTALPVVPQPGEDVYGLPSNQPVPSAAASTTPPMRSDNATVSDAQAPIMDQEEEYTALPASTAAVMDQEEEYSVLPTAPPKPVAKPRPKPGVKPLRNTSSQPTPVPDVEEEYAVLPPKVQGGVDDYDSLPAASGVAASAGVATGAAPRVPPKPPAKPAKPVKTSRPARPAKPAKPVKKPKPSPPAASDLLVRPGRSATEMLPPAPIIVTQAPRPSSMSVGSQGMYDLPEAAKRRSQLASDSDGVYDTPRSTPVPDVDISHSTDDGDENGLTADAKPVGDIYGDPDDQPSGNHIATAHSTDVYGDPRDESAVSSVAEQSSSDTYGDPYDQPAAPLAQQAGDVYGDPRDQADVPAGDVYGDPHDGSVPLRASMDQTYGEPSEQASFAPEQSDATSDVYGDPSMIGGIAAPAQGQASVLGQNLSSASNAVADGQSQQEGSYDDVQPNYGQGYDDIAANYGGIKPSFRVEAYGDVPPGQEAAAGDENIYNDVRPDYGQVLTPAAEDGYADTPTEGQVDVTQYGAPLDNTAHGTANRFAHHFYAYPERPSTLPHEYSSVSPGGSRRETSSSQQMPIVPPRPSTQQQTQPEETLEDHLSTHDGEHTYGGVRLVAAGSANLYGFADGEDEAPAVQDTYAQPLPPAQRMPSIDQDESHYEIESFVHPVVPARPSVEALYGESLTDHTPDDARPPSKTDTGYSTMRGADKPVQSIAGFGGESSTDVDEVPELDDYEEPVVGDAILSAGAKAPQESSGDYDYSDMPGQPHEIAEDYEGSAAHAGLDEDQDLDDYEEPVIGGVPATQEQDEEDATHADEQPEKGSTGLGVNAGDEEEDVAIVMDDMYENLKGNPEAAIAADVQKPDDVVTVEDTRDNDDNAAADDEDEDGEDELVVMVEDMPAYENLKDASMTASGELDTVGNTVSSAGEDPIQVDYEASEELVEPASKGPDAKYDADNADDEVEEEMEVYVEDMPAYENRKDAQAPAPAQADQLTVAQDEGDANVPDATAEKGGASTEADEREDTADNGNLDNAGNADNVDNDDEMEVYVEDMEAYQNLEAVQQHYGLAKSNAARRSRFAHDDPIFGGIDHDAVAVAFAARQAATTASADTDDNADSHNNSDADKGVVRQRVTAEQAAAMALAAEQGSEFAEQDEKGYEPMF